MAIKYLIDKTQANSLRTQAIRLMMTDGQECRELEIVRPLDESPHEYIQANINEFWWQGTPLRMQLFRASAQRALNPVINETINAVYGVFSSEDKPTLSPILIAANEVLANTPKMAELQKLHTMLQSLTQQELRQFLALIIMITMSKSAQG